MSKQDCCCYNSGIVCGNVKNRATAPEPSNPLLCMKCAWNPDVGKLRTKIARIRLGLPAVKSESTESKTAPEVKVLPVCYYCTSKIDELYEVLGETQSLNGQKVVCAFCGKHRYGGDFRLRERSGN